MKIEGELIYLTPITYDDCEDFVRWRNSDLVKSRFIYRKDLTVEDQRNWIRTRIETGQVVQFIIWDRADNKKIGSVYFQDIDSNNRKCEYGILIGEEEYLNGGRGTETARLALEYAFNNMNMHRVYLRLLSDNVRALKSYEHVGFKQEGVAHDDVWLDGKPVDVIFMAAIRPE